MKNFALGFVCGAAVVGAWVFSVAADPPMDWHRQAEEHNERMARDR